MIEIPGLFLDLDTYYIYNILYMLLVLRKIYEFQENIPGSQLVTE